MAKISAIQVKAAKHPGGGRKGPFLISDGSGLYLQITESGTKSWLLRFMLHGKSRNMGLGSCDLGSGGVSLAEARQMVVQAKALLRQGLDPIEARNANIKTQQAAKLEEQAKSITFEYAAQEYINAQKAAWSNSKHRAQWLSTLKTYAFPVIGHKAASEIDADAVEAILKPIWLEIPETASRLRGRIEAVLDFAKAKGWRSGDNPARWKESLKHRLPPTSKVRRIKHYPALPWSRMPEFMIELKSHEGISVRALEFVILNACRSGEARGAKWNEIDLAARIWTIPAERMKSRREHRIPLSGPAMSVLKELLPFKRGPNSYLFPSNKSGKMLTDMALSMLVRGMNEVKTSASPPWVDLKGVPVVVHGFRSTFRDWAEEATSTPHAVSEAALAHVVGDKVEAAYRRSDLFEKRRELMDGWAQHCMKKI